MTERFIVIPEFFIRQGAGKPVRILSDNAVEVDKFRVLVADDRPVDPSKVGKFNEQCPATDKWFEIRAPAFREPACQFGPELPLSPGPLEKGHNHTVMLAILAYRSSPGSTCQIVPYVEMLIRFVNASFVREVWKNTEFRI